MQLFHRWQAHLGHRAKRLPHILMFREFESFCRRLLIVSMIEIEVGRLAYSNTQLVIKYTLHFCISEHARVLNVSACHIGK